MTTQRRSWLTRVSVVAVVAFGALVGVSTPAFAENSLQGASLSPTSITVGAEATFKFKVKADPPVPQLNNVSVETTFGNAAECSGTCSWGSVALNAQGESQEFSAKIKGLNAGQTGVRVEVNGNAVGQPTTLTVQAAQQTVGKIEGFVKNITDAKPIKGAIVALQDGAQKTHQVTADNNGIFRFDGPGKKIAPGLMVINVTKSPFTMVGGAARTFQLAANQDAIGMEVLMEDLTLPSATPAATAEPTPSVTASAAPVLPEPPGDDGGMDSMTLIMIIVGGVLVALGIGAIVLLVVRRNSDDDDEDEEEVPARGRPGPRGPQGAPQSPGYRPPPPGYGQPGYGRPADPTMVGNQFGPPQHGGPQGYGAPTQQWNNPQQPGYGAPQTAWTGYEGQPGYGQQPGYPPQQGYAPQYDETTHYAGPTSGAGGYDQPGYSQGYPPQQPYDQGGYAQPDQYGGQGYQQDPYGGQPGYGQPGYEDDRRTRGDRRLDWLDD